MFERLKRAFSELVRKDGAKTEFSSSARVFSNWGLIDGTQPSPERPYEAFVPWDFTQSVSPYDFMQVRSQARKLFTNLGPARAAILQRTNYAFGRAWQPRFMGTDIEWGKAAAKVLTELWYPIADIRGYDFVTALQLDSFCVDVDGDILVIFTQDENGFPLLSRVRAHRVNDGEHAGGGIYSENSGYTIYCGVIRDHDGRPIGYRVETGGQLYVDKPKFTDYSVADCMLISDPEFPDQPRGLPAITHALQDLLDLKHTVGFQKQATMLAATIGLLETNEIGGPTNLVSLMQQAQSGANPGFPVPPGVTSKEFAGGLVRYFRAGSGGKIEVMYNKNPHENWERFMNRLERHACEGIPWPWALAISPETLGGANSRLAVGQAMRSVADRQELFRPAWVRMIRYAVAKFIALGALEESPEWDQWEPSLPPRLSVDAGRDRTADQNDYRLGIRNLTDILDEQGLDLTTHLITRATEVAMRKKIAEEIGAKFGVEITDGEMCLLNPNQAVGDSGDDGNGASGGGKLPAEDPPARSERDHEAA